MLTDLQFVFNDVVSGTPKKVAFVSKAEFESTRTALLRKFRRYKSLLNDLGGADPFEGKFLRCAWIVDECAGSFYLCDEALRTNRPGKILQILDLVDEQELPRHSLQLVK